MKFINLSAIFIISCSSLPANAITETLSFESLKQNDDSFTYLTGTYAEAGYKLDSSESEPYSFASVGDLNTRYAGSTALTSYNFGTVILYNTSGTVFDFLSMDLAPVFLGANDPFGSNRDLSEVYETIIYGFRDDGSFVNQVLTIPNTKISNVMATVQMIGFTGLNEVLISNDFFPGVQFDNLVLSSVSAVPEPSSAWLFTIGLLGFLGLRKRN